MPELAPAPTQTSPQVVINHVERLHIPGGPEAVETPGIPDLTAEGRHRAQERRPGQRGRRPTARNGRTWLAGGGRPLVSAAFASLLAVAQGRADGSPAVPPPPVTPVPFPNKRRCQNDTGAKPVPV